MMKEYYGPGIMIAVNDVVEIFGKIFGTNPQPTNGTQSCFEAWAVGSFPREFTSKPLSPFPPLPKQVPLQRGYVIIDLTFFKL